MEIIKKTDYTVYKDDCSKCKYNSFMKRQKGKICQLHYYVEDWENPDYLIEDGFGTRRINEKKEFIHCSDFIEKTQKRREYLEGKEKFLYGKFSR